VELSCNFTTSAGVGATDLAVNQLIELSLVAISNYNLMIDE
jgi:hypothetical protein